MIRITHASLHEVTNTLINPFHASSHATQALHHILVRLEDEEGAVGWGESATLQDPYYLGETTETAWHVLRDFLLPLVMGKPWETIDEFAALYSLVKGNTFARCGIEMAAWDLLGRRQGRSVADLLGGTRDEIHSGVSLGIERDTGRLLDLIARYLDEGYRRVKLKVAPGMDLEVLERVRARFPAVPLMVDANAAYSLSQLDHLRGFDAFDLTMIEQPLDDSDLFAHAQLQRQLRTPICLDESLRSAADTRQALELGSCRVVNVKVARLGGLLEALRVHDICRARGVPVWCGGMHDFGVGRAANLALASLPGFSIPGDVSGFDKYFAEDIVDPPIVARDGALAVPRGRPGLGHDLVSARIAGRTVRTHAVGAAAVSTAGSPQATQPPRAEIREQRRALFDRIYAFYDVKVLAMALRTRLFEHLAGSPGTAGELAAAAEIPERSARGLLIALSAMGLIAHAGGRYSPSERGARFFVEASPQFMGDVVRFADWQFDALPRIDQVIQSGAIIWDGFDHYLHNLGDDPAAAERARRHETFNAALAGSAVATARTVLGAVDLGASRRMLDVGGNLGVFTSVVLEAHPQMQSTIFDLPEVAEQARREIDRRGLTSRVQAIGGDFCADPWPGGHDLVAFIRILATRDRAGILELLGKAYDALPPGGRVLFYEEHVLGPDRNAVPPGAAWATLFILMGSRGEVRYSDEWAAFLAEAGFVDVRQVLGRPWGILLGTKPAAA